MKSNTYAAFLTMLLIVVYPLVRGIPADGSKHMTRFIPDGALVYFEQQQASIALKEFTQSPLGQKFESINFLETGEKIGLSSTALSALKDVRSFYASIKKNKLFHGILGKRFAVAILSPIDLNEHAEVKDYIKENAVVIAKADHSMEGIEFLGQSYGSYGQIYPVSSVQYGNHRIKRMKIKDQTFSLVTIEGFFVMSINEKQLRRCIDTFDHELPALADNDNFAEIRKSFAKPDRFFYLPVNDARKFVTERVSDMTFTGKELLLKEMATTVGFANFGYGSWNKKKSVIDKVLVQYESDEVNSVVKNHIDAVPSRCSMLSLTTENPMAFYWSNTIMINHFLRYIEKSRKVEPQLEKFWSNVERVTGKNAEDIFSLLGEEVSIVLEPGPEDKFFSFPLGMFFVRVKNVPELQAIFEKLINEYEIQISVRSYGPIRYSFWTPSPQDGLQPLYGFWDDLIFFGNSSRFL
jgi:hypothetical protein